MKKIIFKISILGICLICLWMLSFSGCKKKKDEGIEKFGRTIETPSPEDILKKNLTPTPIPTPEIPQKKYTITGKVRGSITNSPKSDIEILFSRPGKTSQEKKLHKCKTDINGDFKYSELTSGNYEIKAIQNNVTLSKKIKLEVAETSPTIQIDLFIRELVNIKGKVIDEATSTPISGLLIQITDSIEKPYLTETDEKGIFQLSDVYLLDRTELLWTDEGKIIIDKNGKIQKSLPLILKDKLDFKDIKLYLVQARALSGKIIDEAEAPIELATIELKPIMPIAIHRINEQSFSTSPASDGFFTFPKLYNVKYNLKLQHPNHFSPQETIVSFNKDEIQKSLTLKLPGGFELSGLVAGDFKGINPQIPLKITWFENKNLKEVNILTDNAGKFKILDIPQKTIEYIAIEMEYFVPFYLGPLILPQKDLKLTLEKGIKISGIVQSRDKSPYRNKFKAVMLNAIDWGFEDFDYCEIFEQEFKNVEGKFSMDVLSQGVFRIEITTEDSQCSLGDEFEVKSGEKIPEQILTLSPLITLTGKIQDKDSQKDLSDAKFQLERWVFKKGRIPSWKYAGEGKTSFSGQFEIKNVLPGQYRLFIEHSQYPLEILDNIGITEQGIESLSLFLSTQPSSTITGVIKDKKGEGVYGIIVEIYANVPEATRTSIAITDQSGNFTFQSLEPLTPYIIKCREISGADWKLIQSKDIPPLNPNETKKIEIILEK